MMFWLMWDVAILYKQAIVKKLLYGLYGVFFFKSFFFFLFYIFLTVVNIGKYFFPLFVLRIWFYNYFYFLLLDLVLFFCCFFFFYCARKVLT